MTVPVDAHDASSTHDTPTDDAPRTTAAASANLDVAPVRADGTDLPGRQLTDEHREYLLGAALTAEWIAEQVADGTLRSANPGDPLPPHFEWVRPEQQAGIWFAFPKANGDVKWQLRPDDPADGPKYGSAAGQNLGYGIRCTGKSDVLLIVEGTKQSHAAGSAVASTTTFAPDAGAIAGAAVVGIPGCTGWSVEGGLPLDLHLLGRDKHVVIAADADAGTNLDVYTAVERLGQAFTLAKSVKFAHVPGGGKSGLDDILAQVSEAERPGLLAAIVAGATDKPAAKKPTPKPIAVDEEDIIQVAEASMVMRTTDAYDRIAKQLIESRFMHPTERVPTLAFNGGVWWEHTGTRWVILDDDAVPDRVWTELAAAAVVDSPDAATGRRYPVSKHRRDNVVAGLRARLTVKAPEHLATPAYWLSWVTGKWSVTTDATGPLIAFRNVLLTRDQDPSTGMRYQYHHTPRYWNMTNLDVDYDPTATSSEALDQLINGAWPDDAECRDLGLEIMGYIVSGETKLQKAFLLWGARRGGKGKYLDTCTWLSGEGQVEASGLSELAGQFGLENWPGKSLAILDDARSERVDMGRLARRILSITGCAMTPVERKGIRNWSGRLPTRILITSNMLLELRDPSGVLATRFEILPFFESHAGREDVTLGDRLHSQLPAIANVALAAYDRLMIKQGGKFTRPASAEADHEMLASAQSAELAFLDACAFLKPNATELKATVYQRYVRWCEDTGHAPKSDTVFYRDLYSATGRAVSQVRGTDAHGNRVQLLKGIELRSALEGFPVGGPAPVPPIFTGPSGVQGPSGVFDPESPVDGSAPSSDVRGPSLDVRGPSGVGSLCAACETAGSGSARQGCQGCQGSSEAGRNKEGSPEAGEKVSCYFQGPVRGDTPDTPDARRPGEDDDDADGPDPEVGGLIAHTSDVFGRPTYSPWLDVDPSEILQTLTADASTVALHVRPADPGTDRLAAVSVATGTARVSLLMDSETHMSALREWLASTRVSLAVHDGPDQLGRLADAGLGMLDKLWARAVDTRILDHLLRPGDGATEPDHRIGGAMKYWFPTVGFLPTPEAFDVAQLVAALLPQVDEHLGAEVRQREHRLAATIHQSAHRGLAVAHERAKQHLRIAEQGRSKKLSALKSRGITDPNNPKQLQAAFAAAGVTVESTKGAALKSLVLDGDAEVLRRVVLEYREAAATEYAMRPLVNASAGADGVHRVHPVIDTLGARTGRFTTAEPAVTNLAPVHREFLQAEAGHVLVAADYSAIEVRVAAALSGDTALIGRLAAGEDPHTAAAELAGVTREQAKPVLLGWLYGSGIARTAEQLGVTVAEAEVIRDRMAAAMPRLVEWIEGEVARVRSGADRGVSATPLGRRVQVHASRAATVAVNTVVQSAARDVLVRAIERLDDMGWGKFIWLTVHDELVLQVPEGTAAQAVGLLEQAMADGIGGVQLTAKASVLGARWGKA